MMSPGDGYVRVNSFDIEVGDVIIVERKHYEYKSGTPMPSTFYRCIVGEHWTVSGMMKDLHTEPTFEWPEIPTWQLGWIYAGNDAVNQMWKETK